MLWRLLHSLFLSLAFAHPVQRSEPETYLFPVTHNASAISEVTVQELIHVVQAEFTKDLASTAWQIDFDWQQPYIGAGSLKPDEVFRVMLWGGLVRARYMNMGALSAILCHELGHALGGEPKQVGLTWASAEGAADHFASTICLPRLYRALKRVNPHLLGTPSEPIANSLCARQADPAECAWRFSSGIDLIQFLQVYYERDIPFANPAKRAPEAPARTLDLSYPSYQCRMDIYVEGALCENGPACPRLRCWFVPAFP